MNILRVVEVLGGIAHRKRLSAAGATRSMLLAAVANGSVVRVRRDWFALPHCPPDLVAAVTVGGRLSCLSEAARLGLWVVSDGALHLAVPGTASRLHPEGVISPVRVHWGRSPVPTWSQATDPIENVLVHVASCQRLDFAVAVVDSAINLKLVARRQLIQLALTQGSAFATVIAHSTVAEPCGDAQSGLESLTRVRLQQGGIAMVAQAVKDGHHIDGVIGDRLLIQLDGATVHTSAEQHRKDVGEDARLQLQGYCVLRFTYRQVLYDWDRVEATIRSAIAQGRHLWPNHVRRLHIVG